ncbi:MAG TPA: SDR family oxidoreductase [Jatrophihabitans sp.]|nr:SDR family oxidoreductase [Jatrophihabitans sp.]
MPRALITGGSAGLGRELTEALLGRNWQVITDARSADRLQECYRHRAGVIALAGDVADRAHRQRLAAAVGDRPLDLLVNNASTLGETPLPPLASAQLSAIASSYEVNVLAPLALFQLLRANLLRAQGAVLNLSSDAAVAGYPGWGGYGSGKAALDQLTRTLGGENPELACYAVDPGDLRTELHQAAFPGQDISDRPLPATVLPALLRLIEDRPPSGRYRLRAAAEFVAA